MYYRASLSVVTLRQFLKELCFFVNLEYLFEMLSWNFAQDFVLMYYRSSSSVVTLQPSVSLFVHHFSELAFNMHWQLSWNFKFDFGFLNAFFWKALYKKNPFKMFMTGVLCTVCGARVYFNFFNQFLWLRITDKGSIPEMRIWSIL